MALNKDNNFLQSDIWRQFQEAVGNKTFIVKEEGFSASIIEHQLPVVGKYFYIPRGPIMEVQSPKFKVQSFLKNLIDLARENNAGWIRVDPENNQALELIKKSIFLPIKKAPHDMQPREILVMDIAKSEEELLSGMKSKTRYNIKLAEKHGVKVFKIEGSCHPELVSGSNKLDSGSEAGMTKKYIAEFIRLIKLTENRKKIKFHSANYYQKMLEVIPGDILKLYIAEYENKVIAANLVIFYGNMATYLHGATDDEYRNVMAPYLLQWQAIKDAKKAGYVKYDFGGVCSGSTALDRNNLKRSNRYNTWSGITKFKLGFSPATEPTNFPGSFDLIINALKYFIYQLSSRLINIFVSIGR